MNTHEENNSVVCFLWNDGVRKYLPEHVNRLKDLIKKYLTIPHRFICITDEDEGFDEGVELFKLPEEANWIKGIKTLEKERMPSSYRRLWLFSEEAKCLGDRILMLDIDVMVVGCIDKLFSLNADFVGWRPRSEFRNKIKKINGARRIGGGTWLLRTGTHTHIWENFSLEGQQKAREVGWRGSDQAWLSYNLAETCTVFPDSMGIYHTQDGTKGWETIPQDASIIHFNGKTKPWSIQSNNRVWYVDFFNRKGIPNKIYDIDYDISEYKNHEHEQLNIVTCFWGHKFDERYPVRLFKAIERNTENKCAFWCLNDRYKDIQTKDNITYVPMPYIKELGNLNKIYAYHFCNKCLYDERVFLFDLDTLILKNIDSILSYSGPFCMRESINNKGRAGGDLISFLGGWGYDWYEYIINNADKIIRRCHKKERKFYDRVYSGGMQFWQRLNPGEYKSYKREIKKLPNKTPDENTKLVSFHGRPMLHTCLDFPWVNKNWI
jgi:lipopolysaccharide biosynthesis glycosyltransferase